MHRDYDAGMEVNSRIALVTGAARRVGRAIALHLADHGFDVAFTYRSSQREAVELRDQIVALGRRAIAIQADLTELPAAAEWIAAHMAAFSPTLDLLVNNASLYLRDDLADATQMARLMAIHVEAPLLLAHRLRQPLAAAGGCIVNMLDLMGERPMKGYLRYCASKAALANLTRSLAKEFAPVIRVNGIAPGVVEWPADYPEQEKAVYLGRVPLGRAGTPEDVARLVHFLAIDGTYITGQTIILDGGRSIA